MTVAGNLRDRARPGEMFGHPRGLSFLFATEMWERFSYYGMRALLVLYMTKYLLRPEHFDAVIGLGALKSAFEFLPAVFSSLGRAITGLFSSSRGAPELTVTPIAIQPLASLIYGTYTGLVYATPVIGGLIADRWLGQHRTVLLGAALMAIGHFMMAFEPLFLFALTLLVLGNGCFKPNMSAQVGTLYAPGDPRRDRAYSIFYVGINLGAFLAPLVCGTLGEELGWHYGFTAAGVGMTIALVVYAFGMRELPPDALQARRVRGGGKRPLGRDEWRGILALMVLFIPTMLFWATYEQQGNTIALWADDHTDRHIDLIAWKGEIPVTWFQAFNPFMIFAFTPIILALWAWQQRRGREPSTVTKMALGCFGVTLANLIMAGAAWLAAGDAASWLWLLGYFAVLTIGELYLSPIGLSLVSKVSPARIVSMMMGVWLATSFFGNLLAGWLGSYWSSMDKMQFFLMIAGVAGFAGLVIWAFDRPLRGVIGE